MGHMSVFIVTEMLDAAEECLLILERCRLVVGLLCCWFCASGEFTSKCFISILNPKLGLVHSLRVFNSNTIKNKCTPARDDVVLYSDELRFLCMSPHYSP